MGATPFSNSSLTIDGVTISSPVGLIAGNGTFPLEFAAFAKEKGLSVVAVAHIGETDPRIESMVAHCTWIKVGALGTIIKVFQDNGVKNAACIGGIKRVNLFGGVALDLKAMALIAKLRSVRDDVLLRGVASELEASGISVFSPHLFLRNTIPMKGLLTRRSLSPSEVGDARVGWESAALIGKADIGQTVVVTQGVVVAVEAVEGTDRCIERGCGLGGPGAVVVKRSKPQQDLRLDLPSIGPGTIVAMRDGKATALVIEAGKTLVLDREQVVEAANDAGIAIVAAVVTEDLSL